MTDQELLSYRDCLHRIHTGCASNKSITITDGITSVTVQNNRSLNDLLWRLFLQAHNELAARFQPIKEP